MSTCVPRQPHLHGRKIKRLCLTMIIPSPIGRIRRSKATPVGAIFVRPGPPGLGKMEMVANPNKAIGCCSTQCLEPDQSGSTAALGHSATCAGHTLMSEKGSEPAIEPLGLNVAEVPKADLQFAAARVVTLL